MHLDRNYNPNSKKISSQRISDILLFQNHPDPQLRGAIRNLLGNFLKIVSNLCEESYDDWVEKSCDGEDGNFIKIQSIVNIFVEVSKYLDVVKFFYIVLNVLGIKGCICYLYKTNFDIFENYFEIFIRIPQKCFCHTSVKYFT